MLDHDVITRLGEGDLQAAQECVSFLLAWTAKYHPGRGDAEDVVAETLEAACQGASRYRGEAKPTTWLARIASW